MSSERSEEEEVSEACMQKLIEEQNGEKAGEAREPV